MELQQFRNLHSVSQKMTTGETAADTEQYLQDNMLYDILFEIFRRLPREKLIEMSNLCSRFRDVAGDTRFFWKHLHIEYRSCQGQTFDFEDLYSGPGPVKVIDLRCKKISPPVSSNIGRVVQVTKLNLEGIEASEVTVEAILAKYQCTELLGYNVGMGVAPKTFSKLTALEALSLINIRHTRNQDVPQCHLRPGTILRNCKNLKTLDLKRAYFTKLDMLNIAKNLPASLERLNLGDKRPEDSFFKFLVKSIPNLRDLEVTLTCIGVPALLEFQFLETLRFVFCNGLDRNIYDNMYMYFIKFSALKTVYAIGVNEEHLSALRNEIEFETFRKRLSERSELQGISVELIHGRESPPEDDNNLWTVKKGECCARSCCTTIEANIDNNEVLRFIREVERILVL